MNKKMIAIGITSLGLLLGSTAVSAEKLLTSRYDLPSNQQVSIKGNIFSTRVIDCHVRSTSSAGNTLTFVSINNQNIINGYILPEGESTSMLTHIGDHISLEMDSHSEIGITNLSDGLVNLECD